MKIALLVKSILLSKLIVQDLRDRKIKTIVLLAVERIKINYQGETSIHQEPTLEVVSIKNECGSDCCNR